MSLRESCEGRAPKDAFDNWVNRKPLGYSDLETARFLEDHDRPKTATS
jgi:hypothetical protein